MPREVCRGIDGFYEATVSRWRAYGREALGRALAMRRAPSWRTERAWRPILREARFAFQAAARVVLIHKGLPTSEDR